MKTQKLRNFSLSPMYFPHFLSVYDKTTSGREFTSWYPNASTMKGTSKIIRDLVLIPSTTILPVGQVVPAALETAVLDISPADVGHMALNYHVLLPYVSPWNLQHSRL